MSLLVGPRAKLKVNQGLPYRVSLHMQDQLGTLYNPVTSEKFIIQQVDGAYYPGHLIHPLMADRAENELVHGILPRGTPLIWLSASLLILWTEQTKPDAVTCSDLNLRR